LGIECDGAAYHSSQVARDRDRLRQEVLEGLGWSIYRIWGPTWFRGKKEAEEDLRAAIEAAVESGSIHSPKNTQRKLSTDDKPLAIEMKTVEVGLSDEPDWISPYFNQPEMRIPNMKRTSSGVISTSSYDDLIVALVEWEGPVDRAIIQKRFASLLGLSRTKRVQDLVDQRLSSLKANGALEHWKPDCYSTPSQSLVRIRKPEPGDDLTKRSSRSFPTSELQMAIYRVLLDSGSMDREELYNVVVKVLLGLTTLTRQWRERLDDEIVAMSDTYIQNVGSQLRALAMPNKKM
jgi:hypothetical protein